jgi:hypothetical protein
LKFDLVLDQITAKMYQIHYLFCVPQES